MICLVKGPVTNIPIMTWLSLTFAILVLIFVQPPTVTSLKHKNMICDQIQECVCGFPSGQGYNLTNLELEQLVLNDTLHNLVFYFNPCKEATNCSGSLMCVHDEKGNTTTSLGVRGKSTFSSQGPDSPVFLNLRNGDIETEIQLECSTKAESDLILNSKSDSGVKYALRLVSPEACLKAVDSLKDDEVGLSSGSVLVIILLVLILAYLVFGIAANYFLRGATGWEMIPNFDFWKRVPSLFMDGVNFVANGCRPPPSYEQI